MLNLRFYNAIFIVIFFTYSIANAKLFRNAYVQFELPSQWDCQLEGTEWVCSSQNKVDSKESIIILTAKEVGPQDSFSAYEVFLKTPKKILTSNNKASMSIVKNVRQRKINDHPWVDSLHLSSEIPGYYTRYLATIKDKLAILVTLSAHQKYYTKYSNDYFKAVESLRVVSSKELFAPRELAPVKPTGESIGGNVVPNAAMEANEPPPPPENESSSSENYLLGIGIILLAVTGYFLIKKKKS